MHGTRFQLMLQPKVSVLSDVAPIAVARLISLLPHGWAGWIQNNSGESVVTVLIEAPVATSVPDVLSVGMEALSDTAMRDWELVDCRPGS